MQDIQLIGLNVYEEAGGEIPDGQAAIARVTKNRMARKFFSDGTIAGTVLARDQFSWAYFGFETLHTGTDAHDQSKQEYTRLCHTPAEAAAHAEDLLELAPVDALAQCERIAQLVLDGSYQGALYAALTDDTVLYLNPRILTKLPAWAIPSAKVCSIGHHDFYRSVPLTS